MVVLGLLLYATTFSVVGKIKSDYTNMAYANPEGSTTITPALTTERPTVGNRKYNMQKVRRLHNSIKQR